MWHRFNYDRIYAIVCMSVVITLVKTEKVNLHPHLYLHGNELVDEQEHTCIWYASISR